MYQVVNFEKATNTPVSFWKCQVKITHRKEANFDAHIHENYVFVDLEKRIYTSEIGTTLLNLMERNRSLQGNTFFKENIGYYFLNQNS